ncbi:MAG: transposase [Gaiellales bacterium]
MGERDARDRQMVARAALRSPEDKLRIALAVVRGEQTVAETARQERISETTVARWRDQFLQGGRAALTQTGWPIAAEARAGRKAAAARPAHVPAPFCTACGSPFQSEEFRFCSACGAQRLEIPG